jgi:hypothetical protein
MGNSQCRVRADPKPDQVIQSTRGPARRRGSTSPEFATITGHSLKDVGAILEAHCPSRDAAMAWNAIRKLELGMAEMHRDLIVALAARHKTPGRSRLRWTQFKGQASRRAMCAA